jgi:hypothetical protein
MSKHTLEQVLEALINKEDDRASDLLHQFFVQKGKSIYEELSELDSQLEEDEEIEEGFGPAQDFEEEIISDADELEDESLFAEADDEEPADPMAADLPAEEPTEPEATADLAMGDEAGAEGEAGDLKMQADDALDELRDLFAKIADQMGGGHAEPDADNMTAPTGEEETEESYDPLGESASLTAVPAPTHGDNGQNTKSPVSNGPKVGANGAKAVKVNSGNVSGGTEGGLAKPSATAINVGNVNVPGNKKAPAYKNVSAPKNSDSASNKTSPVAKS